MAENNKTQTTTQIRSIYSDGISYMNLKFYNTYLSLQFSPFSGKGNTGQNQYDQKKAQVTTVDFARAFGLWKACYDIIFNGSNTLSIIIQCNQATLHLERKSPGDTWITINKNNETIPFKFESVSVTKEVDGVSTTEIIETGLGAFMKTVEGYLVSINADRHYDKLTEEFAKLQESSKGQGGFQTGSGYNRNNYNRNNNRGNYGRNNYNRNNYNNNQGGQQNQQQSQPWETNNQQNMSTYQPPQ